MNEIDSKLKGKQVDPKIKSKLKRAGKSWEEQLNRGGVNAQVMGERVIQVNHRLNESKAQARRLLTSDIGLQHRSQQPADMEQTFEN